MNEQHLLWIGGVLAAAALLAALMIVITICKYLLGVTTNAVGQILRLFLRFLLSKATDVCFLNMLGIIFCLIAERLPGNDWSIIALGVSISAFVQASLYIVALLISGSGVKFLKSQSVREVFTQIRLNIGFLGLLYLSLAFCSTCYAWHQITERTNVKVEHFDFVPNKTSYEPWFSYTAQQAADSMPEVMTKHFKLEFSDIKPGPNAAKLSTFAFIFRLMFWAGLAAQMAALLLPQRILTVER